MDPEVWSGWESIARVALTSPGCSEYYESRQTYLNPHFRKWMGAQVPSVEDKRLRRLHMRPDPGADDG